MAQAHVAPSPTVSILVCAYGDVEWRRRAKIVADSFAARDAEVLGFYDADGTLASVRNRAAGAASGDWLCFVDADDQLDPGYLPAMVRAMTGQPALLIPSVRYVSPGHRGVPTHPGWGRPVVEVNAAVIGTLVPRQLFHKVGGFHEYLLYEDWDLWLRCLTAGAKLVHVPDAVYIADGTPGRNVGDRKLRESVYWAIRQAHEPDLTGRRWENG